MLEEAREAPSAVARQLAAGRDAYAAFGERLRSEPPAAILTLARGSSDHAAQFAAYLLMARLGRLVTSLPMSVVTLYQAKIATQGLLALAFSQSGRSTDLVETTRAFTAGNATTVAFVNDAASPLARASRLVFALEAGDERSVAATKSFIAQLVAGVRLAAAWQGDAGLAKALDALPPVLEAAARADWTEGVDTLANADRLFVLGRGTGLAIAMEAALKFKETCGIQAEALSGAEVRHGPIAMVTTGYPVLVFAPRGPAQAGLLETAHEMRVRGARVLLAAPAGTEGAELPLAVAPHPDLDPIAAVQSFYPMAEALSRKRGLDPDRPPHLAKVTLTH
jgi:glucosamine--fructose-6-phosphate aminotransferase (isomerizing)